MNKSTKAIYTCFALLFYVGFMVGFGFILNLFWKMSDASSTMFWVTTGVVCACVVITSLLSVLTKKDKGLGAMQVTFSVLLSLLPIVVRTINLIPTAGIYISAVLLFFAGAIYLFTMLGLSYYGKDINANSDNTKHEI